MEAQSTQFAGLAHYCRMIDEDDAKDYSADSYMSVCKACRGRGYIAIEPGSSTRYACPDCHGPDIEEDDMD